MLMTEEEAKTKWCPFTRVMLSTWQKNPIGPELVHLASGYSHNRQTCFPDPERATYCEHLLPHGAMCIASKCMMWQWQLSNEGQRGFCALVRPSLP